MTSTTPSSVVTGMLGKVGDGNVNTVSGLCVDTGFVGITVSTGFAGSTGPVIVLPIFLIVHFPIFLSYHQLYLEYSY